MPHGLFLVSSEDIQKLNDEQARELVARLVRAESERRQAADSSITWGGDQRAKDGGIDVRFSSSSLATTSIYIPTPVVGYQVKAEPFPPSKIGPEMAPGNKISASIAKLLNDGHTYVIVSSRDTTSDSALTARKLKMKECATNAGLAGKGTLDFFDARRLADWVEQYPSIGVWVKDKVATHTEGWRPYGAWAYRESDPQAEYLLDDKVKVFVPNANIGSNAREAIDRIRRDLLANKTVRLVGLSGVGKTRLLQAVFDARIVTDAGLPSPDTVIYADLSDHLDPQPTSMVETLTSSKATTVLVIDNCGQDLHKRLAELVASAAHKIALVTVEYDIRDDLPEDTSCYRLEGSSDAVIKRLLRARYTNLSDSDINRVAEFSDGNARVAFALASASEVRDELVQLNDDALFKRLFHQKQTESDELLRCAEAASLLYSFDGDDTSATSELALIGSICGLDPATLYRQIAELHRRGLVQRRGKWRAVLPHAIANKLAARAIENIPKQTIIDSLMTNASQRVSTSFSRRLGYLHKSPTAQAIAGDLLKPRGRFSNLSGIGDYERRLFKNILPINPKSGLILIQDHVKQTGASSIDIHVAQDIVRMIKSLAYDAEMFDDGLNLLTALVQADDLLKRNSSAREAAISLFSCHLSGTHAPPEERVSHVRALLNDTDEVLVRLGLDALTQSLATSHFSSQFETDFGARKRDYGWAPRDRNDVLKWYEGFARLALEQARGEKPDGRIRRILGRAIRGRCEDADMIDEVESIAQALSQAGGWPDGWIGVRETIRWGQKSLPATALNRLEALERLLEPRDLKSKIRSTVLARDAGRLELTDGDGAGDFTSRNDRLHENAKQLGTLLAHDEQVLTELLPEFLGEQIGTLGFSFGHGLGVALKSPRALLDNLQNFITSSPETNPNFLLIRGVLKGWIESDVDGLDNFLDEAVSHPVWAERLPELQCTAGLEGNGIRRIFGSLEAGLAPVWQYRYMSNGGASNAVSAADLEAVARKLISLPNGASVAVEILGMVVHGAQERGQEFVQEIANRIGSILSDLDFAACNVVDTMTDHYLDLMLRFALSKTPPGAVDSRILTNILSWERSPARQYAFNRGQYLKPFFEHRPVLALEGIYQPDPDGGFRTAQRLAAGSDNEHGKRPLEALPIEAANAWCAVSPADRCLFLAKTCALYEPYTEDKAESKRRLSAIASELFQMAPDKEAIVKAFADRLIPMSWSGSRATKLRQRLGIFDDLASSARGKDAEVVANELTRMRAVANTMEEDEDAQERLSNESFE
jgi:hypothetical protein